MIAEYENLKLNDNEKQNLWLLLPYLDDVDCFTKNDIVMPTNLLFRYSGENWKINFFNPLKLKCKVFDATTGKQIEHCCHSFIKKNKDFEYHGQRMTNFDEETARMILKNGDMKECLKLLDEDYGGFKKFRGFIGMVDPLPLAKFKKVF